VRAIHYLRSKLPDDDRSDDLRAFLAEVGETELLSADEEVRLAQLIEAGVLAEAIMLGRHTPAPDSPIADVTSQELARVATVGHQAMLRFIEANLRLVVTLARKFRGQLPLGDAIQEGSVGLIRAVQKFDCNQGYKFSTYATWWIRQAIDRATQDHARIIHIPLHVQEQIGQATAAQRALEKTLGRAPSVREVAQAMDRDPQQVAEWMHLARQHASLDAPVDEAGTLTLGELLPAEARSPFTASLGDEDEQARVEGWILDLDDRSADIIRRRYGLEDGSPAQLIDVARHWGITTERVRQLERKALAQIKGRLDSPPN
jgi:RNA polymerase sigma factor (sigma-70 family)